MAKTPVRLGLDLPVQKPFGIGRDIPDVAMAAEGIGYDSLWAGERVLVPESPVDGLYGIPGLPWADHYRSNADPLVALTLAAAVTNRVKLGTNVLVAAFHQPFQLARTLATLDNASGGRVVAGLGTGWSQDEYAAAAVAPFKARGTALDEALDVCAAVWGPDPVSHAGTLSRIAPSEVGPKPRRPIPVLLAGSTPAAFRRIADRADGWIPVATDPALLAGQWKQLREVAAERGRERPIGVTLILPFQGDLEQVVRDAVQFTKLLPVGELVLSMSPSMVSARQFIEVAGALHAPLRDACLGSPLPSGRGARSGR
jgi:probable F420-dependent oxidoreductase